jgi:hypothetical protein
MVNVNLIFFAILTTLYFQRTLLFIKWKFFKLQHTENRHRNTANMNSRNECLNVTSFLIPVNSSSINYYHLQKKNANVKSF